MCSKSAAAASRLASEIRVAGQSLASPPSPGPNTANPHYLHCSVHINFLYHGYWLVPCAIASINPKAQPSPLNMADYSLNLFDPTAEPPKAERGTITVSVEELTQTRNLVCIHLRSAASRQLYHDPTACMRLDAL
jgi:hypothetical protein